MKKGHLLIAILGTVAITAAFLYILANFVPGSSGIAAKFGLTSNSNS
jgi:hypothetical protein